MKLRVIAGQFKGQLILAPDNVSTRPTTGRFRESFFNICQTTLKESSFLDIFAGSGAMGIEALSRGAAFATFIESDKKALSCIKKNLFSLSLQSQSRIYPLDVLKALRQLEKKKEMFTLIYCDPPYSLSLDTLKEVVEKGLNTLEEEGRFFLEFGQDLKDFSIIPKTVRKMGKSYLLEFVKEKG